jgi:hypothetical protein
MSRKRTLIRAAAVVLAVVLLPRILTQAKLMVCHGGKIQPASRDAQIYAAVLNSYPARTIGPVYVRTHTWVSENSPDVPEPIQCEVSALTLSRIMYIVWLDDARLENIRVVGSRQTGLGHIDEHDDGTVSVNVDHVCGALCGFGYRFTLEPVGAEWRVKNFEPTWII